MYSLLEFLLITYSFVILLTLFVHFDLKDKHRTIEAFVILNITYSLGIMLQIALN
jgi:hypothetical protein